MAFYDGKPAGISRMLHNDGHISSDCPLSHRLIDPQNYSSGFIVRKDWTGKITIIHNVNKSNAAQMGPGGTASHINAMLVRYAETVSRLYHLHRQGDTLVVGERR